MSAKARDFRIGHLVADADYHESKNRNNYSVQSNFARRSTPYGGIRSWPMSSIMHKAPGLAVRNRQVEGLARCP